MIFFACLTKRKKNVSTFVVFYETFRQTKRNPLFSFECFSLKLRPFCCKSIHQMQNFISFWLNFFLYRRSFSSRELKWSFLYFIRGLHLLTGNLVKMLSLIGKHFRSNVDRNCDEFKKLFESS